MDHAFRGVHGFGYVDMRSSHLLRMKVERRRQENYEESVRLIAKIASHTFRG